MKSKNVLMLAGLLSILSFTNYSCKKDDDDDDNNVTPPVVPPPTGVMTAKVDGVAWTAVSSKLFASMISNVSNATGVAADTSTITFAVEEPLVAGETYELGYFSGNSAIYAKTGSAPAWGSHVNSNCSGELTVTSLDAVNKKMSGVFVFKGFRASDNSYRDITEGVFTDVTYITTHAGTGNTFSVNIDGTTFTPGTARGYISGGILDLSGIEGSKRVALTLGVMATPGTYPLDYSDAIYYPSSSSYTAAVSGSMTITSHNYSTRTITGTFNFISEPTTGGPPTYNLTNGAFNINYY